MLSPGKFISREGNLFPGTRSGLGQSERGGSHQLWWSM